MDALDRASIAMDEAAAKLEAAAKELRAEADWIRNESDVEARDSYAAASLASRVRDVNAGANGARQILGAVEAVVSVEPVQERDCYDNRR